MTRGCAPLYPGLSHFAPSGLKSRKKVGPSASSGTRLKVGAGHQGGGEHNFLFYIFTSLKRKQRFFKYMFTIHTLFLRLHFRLVRQEIPLRVGFQIRSSLRTKERRLLRQAQGPGDSCQGLNKRFKWSSCSGVSPSQLLCLKRNPHQLMGSKKARGEHQRIYIRRSIRKGGLKGSK